jgi:hypothetical protein
MLIQAWGRLFLNLCTLHAPIALYIYKSYNGLQLEKHDGLVVQMKPSIYENYKENNVGGYT